MNAQVALGTTAVPSMREDLVVLFKRDELAKYLTEGELAALPGGSGGSGGSSGSTSTPGTTDGSGS